MSAVSSLGDATSLSGGTLVMTPLTGAGRSNLCRGAEGPSAVSGFQAKGQAESVSQNVPTTGRIPERCVGRAGGSRPARRRAGAGALSCRAIPISATAVRITDTINTYTRKKYGRKAASEHDLRTVPAHASRRTSVRARFLAEIGALYMTEADGPARVVIDRANRHGCRSAGSDEDFQRVAVSHGNLTVRDAPERPGISSPSPSRRVRPGRRARDVRHGQSGRRPTSPDLLMAPVSRRWFGGST